MYTAREGGHWYLPDGSPAHYTTAKAGHERPTTLADAKRRGLLPSVTTILNVVNKHQLTEWRIRTALETAFDFPPQPGTDRATWVANIGKLAGQPVTDAADEGTRIHAAVEAYYSAKQWPEQYHEHVRAVAIALLEHVGVVPGAAAAEQRVTSISHGYAGTCDLNAPNLVLDLKCKDFGMIDNGNPLDCGKKLAYDQQVQLAAYAVALGYPLEDSQLVSVFVSRTVPGVVRLHRWPKATNRRAWEQFDAANHHWRVTTGYDPRVAVTSNTERHATARP
jgi:hypothetical protein